MIWFNKSPVQETYHTTPFAWDGNWISLCCSITTVYHTLEKIKWQIENCHTRPTVEFRKKKIICKPLWYDYIQSRVQLQLKNYFFFHDKPIQRLISVGEAPLKMLPLSEHHSWSLILRRMLYMCLAPILSIFF